MHRSGSAPLLFSGEYTQGVRTKFVGNYHLPSDLQFELNYTRYKKGQTAVNNTFLEERRAVVSYPFRNKRFTLFSKLSAYQIVLPEIKGSGGSKYTTIEWLMSGSLFGMNTNLTTDALFTGLGKPYVYSTLSLAIRLPAKILFTPQLQYEYSQPKITDVRAEIGKYINSRGYVNVYYENNHKSAFQSVGIGLRYDFSFAVSGLSFTRGSNGAGNMVQSASGGIMYDDVNHRARFNNRSSVGKGAITVVPFLDVNGNGYRDANEPAVAGVGVSMSAGRTRFNKSDKSVEITDLEAYATYTIKLTESFENVAWHIRNKIINITVNPNQFKVLEIPVEVINEASGTVHLKDGNKQKPLSRIIVNFLRADLTPAGETLTEPDGSFSFSGLAPGTYYAQINTAQMAKLNMQSLPVAVPFTIAISRDGELADGLNFILSYITEKAAVQPANK